MSALVILSIAIYLLLVTALPVLCAYSVRFLCNLCTRCCQRPGANSAPTTRVSPPSGQVAVAVEEGEEGLPPTFKDVMEGKDLPPPYFKVIMKCDLQTYIDDLKEKDTVQISGLGDADAKVTYHRSQSF